VTQIGNGNVACVQTAVQNNIVGNDSPQGNGNAQANQNGDNIIVNNITNVNSQAIAQECNITVEQVNTIVKKFLKVNEAGKVVIVTTATASATASASAAAPVQYQYASPSASATASAAAAEETELPDTGGSSLLAIGAMVLLLGGGLTALLAVRRGTSG
jgi:hypothetical protein